MSLSFEKRAVVPADVLVSEVGGEPVLLNLKTEAYYGLDEVGAHMWAVVTRARSVLAACEELQADYDVEPERLRHDLEELLARLVENGLVELE